MIVGTKICFPLEVKAEFKSQIHSTDIARNIAQANSKADSSVL